MKTVNNKIELPDLECVTSNSSRYYVTPDGNNYPSVTTVVNWDKREFFAEWRRNNPGKSEAILSRGTKVHKLIEDYIEVGMVPAQEDPVVNSMFSNLVSMVDSLDEVVAVEAPLYSDLLKLAGRVDCVGIMDGEYCIVDFKTSSKIKQEKYLTEYWCQATAYAIMWQERTGIPVPKIAIMMVSVDGKKKLFTKDSRDLVPVLKSKIDRYNLESNQ
tara:strand:- start:245 stop:889 length:645 start_codon:yes stop_codon:yes gene_type:complete